MVVVIRHVETVQRSFFSEQTYFLYRFVLLKSSRKTNGKTVHKLHFFCKYEKPYKTEKQWVKKSGKNVQSACGNVDNL